MNVGIDLDGVVFDWVNCAIASLKVLGELPNSFRERDVLAHGWYDFTPKQINDFCLRAEPYANAIADLNGLCSKYKVHVFSVRAEEIQGRTSIRLKELCPNIKTINYVKNRGAKWMLAKTLGCQFHLDDDPVEFVEMHKQGLDCILMDRPWNQLEPLAHTAIRVNSINAYQRVCEQGELYYKTKMLGGN